jgi:hypothetical protein
MKQMEKKRWKEVVLYTWNYFTCMKTVTNKTNGDVMMEGSGV